MGKDGSIVVVGIDILPGHSLDSRSKQPHYAAVFMRDEEVFEEYEDISFSRLIRLIWEHKVDIIAVDNVFELARNHNELIRLAHILPPNTRIVQVTGWGPQAVNIKSIAKSMGLDIRGKLTPLKTAYLAALIASRGGGAVVKLLEEKTKIIVSRGRSVSHGGMSFDRYKRSVRAAILSVTKEIRKILDSNGFDYDLVFRKSKGGLEKSIFIVYASRDKLYGLIKPFKNKSVRLTIKPIYKNKFVFEQQLEKKHRGLILGLDPGINTGVAVIDLTGAPILLYSSKNMDRSEIINMVSQLGEVVIVATDVHQPPELVKKIAATLNAKIYVPKHNLSTEEKLSIINKLIKRYPWLEIQDSHERDALAAAYKAYTFVKDKLKTIESYLSDLSGDIDKEKIKIKVVKGKSFAEALEEELARYIESSREKVEEVKKKPQENIMEMEKKYLTRIKELTAKIRYYEALVKDLERQLREKERIIEDLKMEIKIRKLNNDSGEDLRRKIYLLKQELESLRQELEARDRRIELLLDHINKLEDIIVKLDQGEYLLVPKINNLCSSEVLKILNMNKHYNMVFVEELYPLDIEAINILRENRIAILSSRKYSELYKEIRVPIISAEKIELNRNYVVVPRRVLDEVDNTWRIIDKLNSEDEYRRILKMIKKYQEERRKSSKKNQ